MAVLAQYTLNGISLCSGGGGLDRALRLVVPNAEPVLLVEREAFAVASLVAQIEAGCMAPAAVWSDVRTCPGRDFRGLMDFLIGGIPCQPHSLAGRRGGSTDERDLWSPARRIVVQARPWLVIIENVGGFLSAGADEIPGARRVRRDLRKLGYAVTAVIVRASDMGLPHERERVFIVGINDRLADAYGRQPQGRRVGPGQAAGGRTHAEPSGSGARLFDVADDAGGSRSNVGLRQSEPASERKDRGCGRPMADAGGARWQGRGSPGDRPGECAATERSGEQLGDANGSRADVQSSQSGSRRATGEPSRPLVDAIGRRRDGRPEVPLWGPARGDAEQLPGAISGGQHLPDADGAEPAAHGRDDRQERGVPQGEGGADDRAALPGGGRPEERVAHTDEPELRGITSAREQPLLQRDDGPRERPALRPRGPGDTEFWRHVADCAPELLPALSGYDRFRIAMRDAGLAPDGDPSSGAWVDAATGERVHAPRLSAATQSAIRGMADVLAPRIDQLRLLGNGVADAQGALAIRTAIHDLAAAGSTGAAVLVRLMGEGA